MRRLRRFLARPAADRRLLIEASLYLGVLRLGLKLLPFQTLLTLLNLMPRTRLAPLPLDPRCAERLAWAIGTAGPYFVGSRPCLPQALAAQLLLVRRGFPARLHLGVIKGDQGEVQAHAWMETDGRVVVGGSLAELARFTPLLALDAKSS